MDMPTDGLRKLREGVGVAVLFDRKGLEHDGPLLQQVTAQPVQWSDRFVLHAKHAFLLVAPEEHQPANRLVVLTTSANLTESGWWRNVEVADVEVLSASGGTSLRDDLLRWLDAMAPLASADGVREVLTPVRDFVAAMPSSADGPRLWTGHQSLPEFVRDTCLRGSRPQALDLIAPFVDDRADPIRGWVDALSPAKTRVWVPIAATDGIAAGEGWLDAVRSMDGVQPAKLQIDRSMGKGTDGQRYVHAKIVRVKLRDERESLVVVGSPNLTAAGQTGAFHGANRANIETAIVRRELGWKNLLAPFKKSESLEAPAESESDGTSAPKGAPLRLAYDWETHTASARLTDRVDGPVEVGTASRLPAEAALFELAGLGTEDWTPLPSNQAEVVRHQIRDGQNVLSACVVRGQPGPVLVEETGWAERPAVLMGALSPSDILEHWTLLHSVRRDDHTEQLLERLIQKSKDSGVADTPGTGDQGSMFRMLAGVLHAFQVLRRRIVAAIHASRTRAVQSLLFSRQHDSLRTLLERIANEEAADPVHTLLILISADSLLKWLRTHHPGLWDPSRESTRELARLCGEAQVNQAWTAVGLGTETVGPKPEAFREWFEAQWYGEEKHHD